jgi:hypothetical protein
MASTGTRLPAESRAALERAWLQILRHRHPDITWVPCRPSLTDHEADSREEIAYVVPRDAND